VAQQWQVKVPADLAFLSAFPAFMRPGEPVYVTSAQDSALDRRPSLSILYYHQDHLGSSAIIADAAGNIVDETVNYPFGYPRHHDRPAAARAVLPSRYGFTQKEQDDETGLHYFEARYLVATLGRFASVDPLTACPAQDGLAEPQRLNGYAYGLGDPSRIVDPSGLWGQDVHEKKTLEWAKEAGLSESYAGIVAGGDWYVDQPESGMNAGPPALMATQARMSQRYDQSWHFNVNAGTNRPDSRLGHARQQFDLALQLAEWGNLGRAYRQLGMGLHALQDIFAHTADVTTDRGKGQWKGGDRLAAALPRFHHVGPEAIAAMGLREDELPSSILHPLARRRVIGKAVDNPARRPQNLELAHQATINYLKGFTERFLHKPFRRNPFLAAEVFIGKPAR
jgi:RHS repeat-associated protein